MGLEHDEPDTFLGVSAYDKQEREQLLDALNASDKVETAERYTFNTISINYANEGGAS
jgi:hypothetical protein